jgi:hypothetical protein
VPWWIMEAVSPRGLFLPAEQDVLPKILPFEQKSIVFSNSLGLLDCVITRPPPDKTPRPHWHLSLTLSQEWVSCLCSRFNLPVLSSGSIHFNDEIRLLWVDRLAGRMQILSSTTLFRTLVHIL